MPVRNRFAELLPEITGWRHDFHRHPELDYAVHRTAARVAELLRGFGADEVTEGVGRSGVVAVIRGCRDTRARVVALRADMDALPITEITGADYASTTPGVMHACGHDGHTAMLLGAAKYLAETRNFDGTAVLVFQPAEENGAGGLAMVQDGLVERWGIQEFYALHNLPGLPVGQFAIREGGIMAAADQFDVVLTGRGGHAARPQDCVDPVLAAAQLVTALQSLVARNLDPLQAGVVSVCSVETSSHAYNIIPQEVRLRGTVRSLDAGVRDLLEQRFHRVVASTAEALGVSAAIDYRRGYPVTVNHRDATAHAAEVARAVAGSVDTAAPPLMAGEDFSYMLESRPGAYIFLGNGDSAMLHHPAYDFDDSAIPAGASWLAGMVEARMPAG
ncbi:hippurate hydrolase [Paracoccus solventivorans]|uniref:Hippurate hydrolase n=1 Tax=Paracoccus solventivorans TaxID=53463 RepID=A0A1M7EJW6_9RHOB|nr:M20 aminoacylase family protein [Paracoccus solventivorans]SHL92041.1 hippurate hydrolase [Paracoccus solventivorans]